MANFILTPNMNLPAPVPGSDPGPDYANNQNSALTIIDGHTHTSGSGVLITTAAININADLPMNGKNLTLINTLRFNNLSSNLAGTTPNLGCLYEANNELVYNDGAGNVVPITKTGSVNAGAGSITGLPSGTASASYSSGNQTFVWQSATSTPANLDASSVIFRNLSASSHGVTVSAPSALAADYNLIWPLTPAGPSLMTLDTGGNMGTLLIGQGLQNVTGTLEIPNQGVKQIMLQARATGSTVASGGIATSASCGTASTGNSGLVQITNFSITITTTGRPVVVGFQADGTGSQDSLGVSTSASSDSAVFQIKRGTTSLMISTITLSGTGNRVIPSSSINYIDIVAAGTYTYTGFFNALSPTATAIINNAIIYAYEM